MQGNKTIGLIRWDVTLESSQKDTSLQKQPVEQMLYKTTTTKSLTACYEKLCPHLHLTATWTCPSNIIFPAWVPVLLPSSHPQPICKTGLSHFYLCQLTVITSALFRRCPKQPQGMENPWSSLGRKSDGWQGQRADSGGKIHVNHAPGEVGV